MESNNQNQLSKSEDYKSIDLDQDFDDKYDDFFTVQKENNPDKIVEIDVEDEGEHNL